MKIIITLILLGLAVLLNCAKHETVVGGASDQGNALVHGFLYNTNGTPAANVTVQLVGIAYNPRTGTAAIPSATTDAQGEYRFDSLPLATYNLFGQGSGGVLCKESLEIKKDTLLTSDTLRAPGSLSGVVRLMPKNDSGQIFIILLGTKYYTTPTDTFGNFSIANIAEGKYPTTIQTTLKNYNPVDTVSIIVSGQNTVIGDTNAPKFVFLAGVGGCSYDSIIGKATISSISVDSSYCADCYSIKFNFVPDDSTAIHRYRWPSWSDTGINLTIHGGAYPPLSFITQYGISVGNIYECYRAEEIQGTCTPVIFEFKGVGWALN